MAYFPNIANGATPSTEPTHPALPLTGPSIDLALANVMRTPHDPMTQHRVEFTELSLKVREHLVNQLGSRSQNTAARLLFVQGKPGEGKTEGVILACLRAGYHVAVISPGLFSGKEEGAPVEQLHQLMRNLVRYSALHRCRVVLLVDDFDLSIANVTDDTGKTVNTGLLIRELMGLADNRDQYRNADGSNLGVIFTVNDATGLRESLTREGRALKHTHAPSAEDRTNVAWAILAPQTSAERELTEQLVRKFRAQPIAFWRALHHRMHAMHARQLLSGAMPDKAAVDRAQATRMPLVPAIAWAAAKDLRESRIRNFLTKHKSRWGRR